ncbi:hypothetical protein BH09VER1_BH09VER1_21240 [soil metagenome]
MGESCYDSGVVKGVVNFFWFAFLANGLLSFVDEVMSTQIGVPGLSAVRGTVAGLVFLMSLPVAGMLIFSARVPKRVVVPMILFLWWADLCQCFPFQSWTSPWLHFCTAAAQLALAAGLLVLFKEQGSDWRMPFALREESKGFRWKRFLLMGLGMGTALTVSILAAVAFGLAAKLEAGTGGYVRLKRDGIYVVERKFRQGDREVWLAGMTHIARREFYSDILPHADPNLPSVVLIEGVTDRKKLLKNSLHYAHFAKMLHLDSQEDSEYTQDVMDGLAATNGETTQSGREEREEVRGMVFKRADVDVETFSPKTIAFIIAAMGLFQAESLDQVLTAISDPKSPLNDKGAENQVMKDILFSRNDKLVSEIDLSLKNYKRVIVPWGAFHLSGVQSWLISHDFVQQGEVERKAIGFW